jgi:transcriptional regulator with XRE-family HTH domain
MRFEAALKVAIARSGKSRNAIAASCGIAPAYLSHLSGGYRRITPGMLAKILPIIEKQEDRSYLVQAFLADMLSEVRDAMEKGANSSKAISEIDKLLKLSSAQMIVSEAQQVQLSQHLEKLITTASDRASEDADFSKLIEGLLSAALAGTSKKAR